jgi:hypothetical protein
MRFAIVFGMVIVVIMCLGLVGCSGGDEPQGQNAAAPEGAPQEGGISDTDDSVGSMLSTQDLRRRWSASWTTPATGFTMRLAFTVDASGAVSGVYSQPGTSNVGRLSGQLLVENTMTGKVSGTLSFGTNTVFTSESDVVLSVDENMIFYLRGHFITTAFPGNLGVDRIDGFASGPIG